MRAGLPQRGPCPPCSVMSTTTAAPSAPRPMGLSLPVLPPDQITSGTDRFRCDRLHAVLTAADCKKRHGAAHADVNGRGSRQKMAVRLAAHSAAACKGCELGPTTIHPRAA